MKAQNTKQEKEPVIQFKNQFIADMTYQIRTLSNAIIGFSELLRYEELNDSQTEYVAEIYNAGKSLGSLVDDVLELSKIESGQFSIDIADCAHGWLLDKIDTSIQPVAYEKGIEFKINQCTDLPAKIKTDHTRLSQCLINLISSTIAFTESGYVNLNISLEDNQGQPFIRFDIASTSHLVPVDKQEDIFEPFAQISNESIFTNFGVGLTITRHLAKVLGGTVDIIDNPENELIFSMTVPAGVDVKTEPLLEQRKPLESVLQMPESQETPLCAGHVLLAEDQPSNRTVMTLLLETMGMEVSVAEDGLQALEKASAQQFDLILMDIQMPNMTGYEAARALREKGLATPIIALSAAAASDNPENLKQSDFNCFLTKPVDSKKLYEAISVYLPVLRSLESNEENNFSENQQMISQPSNHEKPL